MGAEACRTFVVALFVLSGLPASAKPSRPRPTRFCVNVPPAGFVDLKKRIPSIRLDIRYATSNNFTGAPLPGYGAPGAWMLRQAADALARVQDHLDRRGLGLLVYDAYRPYRATAAMVAWALRVHPGKRLVGPYIARRSKHNMAVAVDLTLARRKTRRTVDMGSAYDATGRRAHTYGVKGRALRNRLILKRAMERFGFTTYRLEWWHFHLSVPQARIRDVPYGCREKPEPVPLRIP